MVTSSFAIIFWKINFSDVLILEQFMRPDGTVLPRQLTGLCRNKQLQIERLVSIFKTSEEVISWENFMACHNRIFSFLGFLRKEFVILYFFRCVMQAHWSGLFPDKTIADFDRSGYKQFNRYYIFLLLFCFLFKPFNHRARLSIHTVLLFISILWSIF